MDSKVIKFIHKTPSLIVALDYDHEADMWSLVDTLDPAWCALKVGSELFTALGPDLVRRLVVRGFKVFLDLKFHDIPNTVAKACAVAADLGVWMLNVHASGGVRMMQAARKAIGEGKDRPLLIAVTVLTSLSQRELADLGVQNKLITHVVHLAQSANDAGLDGVVSSALEVPLIKNTCGQDFLTVTPGIRLLEENKPDWNTKDDQARVMTPTLAKQAGSDYLVIGRPITCADDPINVIQQILAELS